MKLFVIAKRWDAEKQNTVKEIVGTFDKPVMAFLFRDAYNDRYKANAFVITEEHLLNGGGIPFTG